MDMIWRIIFNFTILISLSHVNYYPACIAESSLNESTQQQQEEQQQRNISDNFTSVSTPLRVITQVVIPNTVSIELKSKIIAYCSSKGMSIKSCQCNLLENRSSGLCQQNHTEKLTTPKHEEEVLTRNCTNDQITPKSCLCGELQRYSDAEYTMIKTCQNPTIRAETLQDALGIFCIIYDIPEDDCSCSHKDVPGICGDFTQGERTVKVPVDSNAVCLLERRMYGQVIFTVIASIVGMSGNALVLLVRSKVTSRSLHYQLIFGLAMADFTFSILTLVYNIPTLFVGCKWIYKRAMCKIIPGLLGLSSSIDLGFIVIIAIERFVAIVYPLSGGVSRKQIYLLIVLNAFLSMLAVVPLFIVNDVYDGKCREDWGSLGNSSLIYSWILMVGLFLIPVLATAYLYYKSLQSLKQTLFRREMLITVNASSRNKLIAENKRILLVLSSLLIAFVLLVGPNRIAWLVMDYMDPETTSPNVFIWLKIFGLVPYSLHISVNPIIYSVVDKRFRKTAIHLLKKRKRMLTSSSSFAMSSTSFAMNTKAASEATAM